MDLSENGKCLFTSLQYVESSHAPYQRIRFFLLNEAQTIIINFEVTKSHTLKIFFRLLLTEMQLQ
jgi:hypothetical protein